MTESGSSATLHAEQVGTNELTFTDNSNLKTACSTVTAAGTLVSGGSSTPTLHPTLSGCNSFGLSSTVNTTGCNYEFHLGSTIGATKEVDATLDIECGSGAITITSLTCELKFDTQQGLSTVKFADGAGSPRDVKVTWEVQSLSYTVTKDGIGCPLSGVGSFTKADYVGSMTLRATSEGGGTVGLVVDHGGDPSHQETTAEHEQKQTHEETTDEHEEVETHEEETLHAAETAGRFMSDGDAYPVSLHAVQTDSVQFTLTDNGNLAATCTTITATGTLGSRSSTATLHPEFTGCTAFGFAATITSSGCDYQVHLGEEQAEGSFDGKLDVDCETGKGITIATSTCEVKIDSQEWLGTIETTNKAGSPEDITLALDVEGVDYTVTKDGTGCPLSKVGTFISGDYSGAMTLTGKVEGSAVGVTVGPSETHETETEARLMSNGDKYPMSLDAAQVNSIQLSLTDNTNLTTSCTTITATGTLAGASGTATLHPEFAGCTAFGLSASITSTGCDFQLHLGGKLSEGTFDGTLDVDCESGKSITIATTTCELKIDAQEGLDTLEVGNKAGTPEDVTIGMALTEAAYTVTKDGIGCPLSGTGTFSKADLSGSMTLSGKVGGSATGLTISGG